MRRNALHLTLSAYAVILVLVLLSAVGKAGEKRASGTPVSGTPVSGTPVSAAMLASSIVVPVDSDTPREQELIRDDTPTAVPRVLKMEVTAYCPCKKCCGKNARGITASGLRVSHNDGLFVAADTALLPFHTKLRIPGYAGDKAVPVLDRGGAIKGHRIDVFFPSHRAALEWGRRTIEVTVLD
jgi:3D (Asp-Asp-Asp) domain-containing protein